MENKETKLKSWMMIAYASAVFGFIMMVNMNSAFTNFYLTDVALIPVALIATVLLICRIGDMILVPLVGAYMEKSNLPWGRYRSWLIVGAPILAIFYTLIYTNISMGTTAKIVFFIAVYLIAHVFVNFVYGALYALIPLMTKTNHERSVLSARRMQFSSLGQIVAGYITMPMLLYFTGNGAKAPGTKGFMLTTAVFAIFMVFTFFLAFWATKDFDLPSAIRNITKKESKTSITGSEMAALVFKNPHLLALIVSDTLVRVATFGLFGVAAYYFIYVINDIGKIALFFGNLGIIQFIGSSIFSPLTRKFDKRTLYLVGMSMIVVCHVIAWAVVKDAMMFTWIVGASFIGYAFVNSASPAMFADATDYSELKYGKEGKGFLMNMANMPPKIALIITGTLTGVVLSVIGYAPGIESTPQIISGIRNLTHFMPAVACMIGIVMILSFNKLTKERVHEIQNEIAENSKALSGAKDEKISQGLVG